MARRYKKRRSGGRSKKMPLTIVIPMLIHGLPTVKMVMENKMDLAAYEGLAIGAGGKFDMNKATQIAVPYIAGILAHATIGKKINRYVPKWSPVNF